MNLDCQTRESALESISNLYGISAIDLNSFLLSLNLDAYYERCDPPDTGDKVLRLLLEKEFKVPRHQLSCVSWFHLTRVLPGEQFDDGILPLNEALEHIWREFYQIFLQDIKNSRNLSHLQQKGVPNWLYNLKIGSPLHAGPYAVLVRDVAFRYKEIGNHDYLGMPEIVRDICQGYKELFGESIEDEVSSALAPCIVKFTSDRRLDWGCVEAAIYYLYLTGRGEPLNLDSNTCFDAQNNTIPRHLIIDVEFINSVLPERSRRPWQK